MTTKLKDMIKSNRQKIRRTYAPLTVMTTVKCATPQSPATQTYDAVGTDGSEYSPDRSLFPTVLEPEVCASAPDGSWPAGNANARLANVRWLSNGKDIALDPDWTGLYEVHKVDDGRKGTIEIRRNVGVGEVMQLHMEADLVDFRTQRTVRIVTDPVTLSTTARTGDSYTLEAGYGTVEYYDPAEDRLALDDYNRAHGLKSLTDAERMAAARERSSYLRSIPLRLWRGTGELTEDDGIEYRVYRMEAGGKLNLLGGGFDELVGTPAVGKDLCIDMRLSEGACYLVAAMLGKHELARGQFQTKRRDTGMTLETHNGASMADSDRVRVDVATAKAGERIVEQPDRLMRIAWKTENSAGVTVSHNRGAVGRIDLARAGAVAGGAVTGDLAVWCEAEMRPAHRMVRVNGRLLRVNGRAAIMN
ncbi:MAG: hypothetical protein HDR09_21205 [Lachnospiraceae bacterium]|nr:hypothetical protein [Lachnospiraceae bacterium]